VSVSKLSGYICVLSAADALSATAWTGHAATDAIISPADIIVNLSFSIAEL
jgi:hypothetical protein